MKYITKKARLSETERNQNSKQSEDAHSAWGFVQHRGNDIHATSQLPMVSKIRCLSRLRKDGRPMSLHILLDSRRVHVFNFNWLPA